MGAPRLASTSRNGSRTYPWPPDDLNPTEAPSVTTVLRSLAKPALVPWAAKVTAEQAVAMTKSGALQALVAQDEAAAVAAVKDAPRNQRDSAGGFGTAVHEALEAWATGSTMPTLDGPGSDAWGHLAALLDAYEVEPLYAEATVYGDTDDPATVYAGTCDLVADVTVPGEGRMRFVLDCKTNRGGVYPEAAYQLAAYRHASHLVTDAGDVVHMPGVVGGLVLATRPERAEIVPVDTGAEALALFRHLRAVHHLTTNGPRYVRRPLSRKGAAA